MLACSIMCCSKPQQECVSHDCLASQQAVKNKLRQSWSSHEPHHLLEDREVLVINEGCRAWQGCIVCESGFRPAQGVGDAQGAA
jgi:hypothetical protein